LAAAEPSAFTALAEAAGASGELQARRPKHPSKAKGTMDLNELMAISSASPLEGSVVRKEQTAIGQKIRQ
jgi:sensor domain CHASE-containing protein